ncbi:FAD:protein FMN transferase [Marivirga arenosa]|uniref:FAD:protein FMN transferase n=1 Tax=Marivirga arenosa TaxID=3059076 RepID=A0AA51N446_9BACT|nr:FAD:protein FMN transferase [Marivirga sp. ABR2-2]WMN05981.1 FAD:protein FMN transferase [Marivirga sp. ABR2-2]
MTNRTKNSIYSLILIALVAAVWFFRNNDKDEESQEAYFFIAGDAQGTTYNINYLDPKKRNLKNDIDSILHQFDLSLSTYVSNSEIAEFNENDSLTYKSEFFYPVLKKSEEIYKASEGAFDPTVYPLIEAWGFGPKTVDFPDSSKIEDIKQYVGFDLIEFDEKQVIKTKDKVSLDFNAIAQGYSIDVVYDYLTSKGIENMMIELGGELRVAGKNEKGDLWAIGIDDPKQEQNQSSKRVAIIKLENEAISTSGNYRKFFVHEGKKYGHSINPKTGYPIQRDIISATVVAPSCMEADAWSTAFMVTGLEKAKTILKKQKHLKAFFIYEDENGDLKQFSTENLSQNLITE